MYNCTDFVSDVRSLVAGRLDELKLLLHHCEVSDQLLPGKMLRTRLAGRLSEGGLQEVGSSVITRLCAATELAHTASLCHDDVIDNALIRRAAPTLWRTTGRSAAVLIGDLLLCESTRLVLETNDGHYMASFTEKLREVCSAEAEQELAYRGKKLDVETCLGVARGKTGPLFAFVASACAGDDLQLSSALEEVGYRIGTAYQLADDLLDETGEIDTAGKTLGTDVLRRKFTLTQSPDGGASVVRQEIDGLCNSAVGLVEKWPEAQTGIKRFFSEDVQVAFDRHLCDQDLSIRTDE